MGLDDFTSNNKSTGPPKKTKTPDSSNTEKINLEDVNESEYDMIISNPKDPRYEVDGIEHLPNVLVTFNTEKHPSGVQHNAMLDQEEYINKEGNLMSGSNTVKITAEEFEEALNETGLDFKKVDYRWANEIIYEAESEKGTFVIRVYSTIDKFKDLSRDTGEDSIKINVLHKETGKPLFKTTRTYRVPSWKKNLKKKIRKIVNDKDKLMICSKCGSVMVIRENSENGNKFYGCASYPKCRNTVSFQE